MESCMIVFAALVACLHNMPRFSLGMGALRNAFVHIYLKAAASSQIPVCLAVHFPIDI